MTPVPLLSAAAPRFGRVLETRQAGDFELRLSRYDGAAELPAHRHPDAYFCYVVDGGLDEHSGGRERSFGPGSLHFHPPGDPHSGRTGRAGLQSLSIVLRGEAAARATGAAGHRAEALPFPLALLAARCWTAFLARDAASALVVESAVAELVAVLGRDGEWRDGFTPGWVAAVRDRLHASFRSEVVLRDLAALARVHEVHVVRGFRKRFGVTPGVYLRRLRIEAACRALLETTAPIVDIAGEAGFYDQSHFTRAFRRQIGLPPAAFRRLHAPLRRAPATRRFSAS